MHRTIRTLTLAAIAVALIVGGASAEGLAKKDWNRTGWYVGLNGIYAADFFGDDIEDALGASFGDSGGLNTRVGYRFNRWVALEAEYEWVDSLGIEIDLDPLIVTYSNATHTIGGNVKLIAPWFRLQPYILLGLAGQRSTFEIDIPDLGLDEKVADWNFAGRLIAGLDFPVTDNWMLNFEIGGVLGTSSFNSVDATDLFYLTVGGGITYRF